MWSRAFRNNLPKSHQWHRRCTWLSSQVLHQLFALLEEGEKLLRQTCENCCLRGPDLQSRISLNPEKKAELLPEDSSKFQWDVLIQNIFNEKPNVNTIGDKFLRIEKCETIWQRIPAQKLSLLIGTQEPFMARNSQMEQHVEYLVLLARPLERWQN